MDRKKPQKSFLNYQTGYNVIDGCIMNFFGYIESVDNSIFLDINHDIINPFFDNFFPLLRDLTYFFWIFLIVYFWINRVSLQFSLFPYWDFVFLSFLLLSNLPLRSPQNLLQLIRSILVIQVGQFSMGKVGQF
jgi:hypothetical protein